MMDGWRIRKALRSIVIAGSTFGLIYYGLEGANGMLASLLVLIGAIAVGMGWAKVWVEPKRPDSWSFAVVPRAGPVLALGKSACALPEVAEPSGG